MGRQKVKKPHHVQGVITEHLARSTSVSNLPHDNCFLVSFRHLDRNQAQTFREWQDMRMLSEAMELLAGYCHRPLLEQADNKKFTIYGDFPAVSEFSHPKHVPEDANWARIHVDGTHVLAGHIFENTFYVVFLDAYHKFWISEKKNT